MYREFAGYGYYPELYMYDFLDNEDNMYWNLVLAKDMDISIHAMKYSYKTAA